MISCLKNCKVGDILHTVSEDYICTSDYIDSTRLDSVLGGKGHILLRSVSTHNDTYITLKYSGVVKRIIKKRHH